MAKKPTGPGLNQFFGSAVKTTQTPSSPAAPILIEKIPTNRSENPKALKLYNSPGPKLPRMIFPIDVPKYKQLPLNDAEKQYFENPNCNKDEHAIIKYLIDHRECPWPFSHLRIAAAVGIDDESVLQLLKLWAHKKWYGVRRTTTGAYSAFLYYSEYFFNPLD